MNLNPADLNISDTLSNLAKIMHDYLKIFQTDRPMVPFIADELEKQMRKIMDIVLKRSVLSETPTPYTLIKLDLDSEKNLLPADNINIGTDLKEMMKISQRMQTISYSFAQKDARAKSSKKLSL